MLLMFAYMNFQWVSVVSEGSDTFCILSQNAPCPDDFTFKQKENHEHCGDDVTNVSSKNLKKSELSVLGNERNHIC